jgi:hypothetical protein
MSFSGQGRSALRPARRAEKLDFPFATINIILLLLFFFIVTGSIVGMFYLVGPIALRLPLPATRWDLLAYVAFVIGVRNFGGAAGGPPRPGTDPTRPEVEAAGSVT